MRLFVGAYPPEHVRDHLAAMVDRLAVGRAAESGINARLAPRSNWHLTVVFLGDVPDDRPDDVAPALARAATAWRPAADGPTVLRLAGGGTFGRGRFTVLWVGVEGGVAAVGALGSAIRRQLRKARLPYDRKPFRPHLTLARPGDRVDVRADVAELKAYRGPEWTVDEIHLMRSHLGPKPSYDRLATICL